MPHEPRSIAARVAALNARYRHRAATSVIEHGLRDADIGRVAMVSSFGAESVVLLHMVAMVDRKTPVLFVETGMLFAETLSYQREVAAHLGLSDLRLIRATPAQLALRDPGGDLHQSDPDACCALRKSEPLDQALAPFGAWITGRKRFQSGTRAALSFFEVEHSDARETGRIKINPLAHWAREDVADYMINNRLPRHPLVARGYPSIGCAPCTTPVAPGEDPRAGRWRGRDKDECGIHFVDGKMVRGAIKAAS